jgi:DNA-binding LytR/AlgR family response regulator
MRENGPMFSSVGIKRAVEPSDERIRENLTVGLQQRAAARSTSSSKALPQTRTRAIEKSARVAIKAKGKILFIHAADLIAVQAKGNYVLLLHSSGSFMLRESISTIENKLNLHGFVRIHRSVLVNASLVDEIWPLPTGEYGLRVRNGKEYVVTRRYKDNIRHLAYVWLGSERFCGPARLINEVNGSTKSAFAQISRAKRCKLHHEQNET